MFCLQPLDDRIVVFGMSCVGKTTFAKQLMTHHYYCFDALFQWHEIETLGLAMIPTFERISEVCTEFRFVLDGWHLFDKEGRWLPTNAIVYVVYCPYQRVISQYRVPVAFPNEHISMFHKWYYDIAYDKFPTRYFLNEGEFSETSRSDYLTFLECNRGTEGPSETPGTK